MRTRSLHSQIAQVASSSPSRYLRSLLLRRVSALGRALMIMGGLTLTALGPLVRAPQASSDAPQPAAAASQASSAELQSRYPLPADDARAGEQVELVSAEVRKTLRPPVASSALFLQAQLALGPTDAAALRWCDVVQCRRLGGARLLGFATPPPRQT